MSTWTPALVKMLFHFYYSWMPSLGWIQLWIWKSITTVTIFFTNVMKYYLSFVSISPDKKVWSRPWDPCPFYREERQPPGQSTLYHRQRGGSGTCSSVPACLLTTAVKVQGYCQVCPKTFNWLRHRKLHPEGVVGAAFTNVTFDSLDLKTMFGNLWY